jgi:hypothetical protein
VAQRREDAERDGDGRADGEPAVHRLRAGHGAGGERPAVLRVRALRLHRDQQSEKGCRLYLSGLHDRADRCWSGHHRQHGVNHRPPRGPARDELCRLLHPGRSRGHGRYLHPHAELHIPDERMECGNAVDERCRCQRAVAHGGFVPVRRDRRQQRDLHLLQQPLGRDHHIPLHLSHGRGSHGNRGSNRLAGVVRGRGRQWGRGGRVSQHPEYGLGDRLFVGPVYNQSGGGQARHSVCGRGAHRNRREHGNQRDHVVLWRRHGGDADLHQHHVGSVLHDRDRCEPSRAIW